MWTTPLSDHPMVLLQWGVVLGASLVAALWDLTTRRIPNLLTGTLFLSGLVAAQAFRGGSGLADAGAGALLMGIPFVALFVLGGGGAGDAKLMAALGTWLGLANSAWVLFAVVITGAVVGLVYALARRRMGPVLSNLRRFAWNGFLAASTGGRVSATLSCPSTEEMLAVPYGLSIFLGLCAAAGGRLLWHM